MVYEFQGHSGSDALVTAFLFWKQEEITRGQIMRVRRMEDHIHVLAAADFCGLPSMSNRDNKLHGDPPHVHVLPQNSLQCSIREA
jgi:hypothetical protein